jgi:hypothetical protein
MNDLANDNGEVEVRCLEARFHPNGRADEYFVVGTIVCRGEWAVCELATDLTCLPGNCSNMSIGANLRYLTIMSRPRPFETLRGLESNRWSFAPTTKLPTNFGS